MEERFLVGDYLVEPQLNRIRCGDERIPIESKAMDVLVFLANHPREVMSKERIIQAVWPNVAVTDDVVTHAISELRKAFQDTPAEPRYIQTIPRKGYRLIASVRKTGSAVSGAAEEPQEKEHPSEQDQGSLSKPQWSDRWYLLLTVPAILLLIFVLDATLLERDVDSDSESTPLGGQKTITVLPFENLANNSGEDYFSRGISEDITTELTKINALRIVGRPSSFLATNTGKSPAEIALDLDVENLLMGSVRRTEGRVRIVAQLIDVETDEILWAETYDRNLDDIFAVQTDVARKIASALRVELSPDETERIEEEPTTDFEAYNLYLQGRYFRNLETLESSKKAVELLQEAVEIDPNYALAYAGLAEAYVFLGWTTLIAEGVSRHLSEGIWRVNELPEIGLFEKAETSAHKALELDDALAECHVAMGLLNTSRGDTNASLQNFRHAVRLNPNLANARRELGLALLWYRGKRKEALTELTRAYELDPLSPLVLANLGMAQIANGYVEKSMRLIRQLHEVFPTTRWEFVRLGDIHFLLSDWAKAESYYRKYVQLVENHTLSATGESHVAPVLSRLYWLKSAIEDVEREMNRLLRTNQESPKANLYAGMLSHMKGDIADSLQSFEKAYRLSTTPVERIFNRALLQDYEYSTWLGYAYWRQGRLEEANEKLNETISFYQERLDAGDETHKVKIGLAGAYAIRADTEEAYRWLHRAIDEGFLQYAYLERHPFFENLHDDPQFQQMMAGLKTKVAGLRAQVAEMERAWELEE